MRSGAQTLVLLADPLNALVLRELVTGPKRQVELRRAAASPAQTTLRAHLNELTTLGAIAKQRRNRFPGVLEFELTEAGHDLIAVIATLRRWLEAAPEGGCGFATDGAKTAIKALAGGWSTTILRALAAGPRSLTELDRVIGFLSYPAIERRLGTMRLAGQVEARAADGKGTPYAVTHWLRKGVAPLAAAARWERRHRPLAAAPIGRIDTETAFLLAVPLLRLPADLSGSCRMAMEIPNGSRPHFAGVVVEVAAGKIQACTTRLQGNPDAWASGMATAWLTAMTEVDTDRLELGGDGRLARSLVVALHEALSDSGAPGRSSHAWST